MSAALGTLGTPRLATARLMVVKLVFVVYWMLLFEGAFRKWIFPQYQQYIFFVRDPLVLAAIGIAFYHRLVPRSLMLTCVAALGIVFAYLGAYHVGSLDVRPITVMYGWRNYFLYAFLAIVISHTFTKNDVLALLRFTLLVAIPMAVLAFWQFRSPKSAFINVQLNNTEVFTVARGVVRTTGTFTFTLGMSLFIAAALVSLAVASFSQRRLLQPWLLVVAFIAVITCLAVSGSRTAFVHAIIIAIAVFGLELSRPLIRQRLRVYLQGVFLVAAFVLVMLTGYSDSLSLLAERMRSASAGGENFSMRFLTYLIGGVLANENPPFFGYGLGVGTVGGSYLETGRSQFNIAEYEFDRVALECGPMIGITYMVARWILAIAIFRGAIRCMRENRDPIPMLLVSFSGVLLVTGQITFQGTSNGFSWIFTGLTMAAIARSADQAASGPTRPRQTVVVATDSRVIPAMPPPLEQR